MTTRIDLINTALVRLGDPPVAEGDPGADALIFTYESIKRDIVSGYPWHWSTRTKKLARLTAVPAAHWAYLYGLPSEMIGSPRAVFDRSDCRVPMTAYELLKEGLATDAANVWLQFSADVAPVYWPGYVAETVTLALMAEYALQVREDHVLRDKLRRNVYGSSEDGNTGKLGADKAIDAGAKPSPRVAIGANPLITVRTSGAR